MVSNTVYTQQGNFAFDVPGTFQGVGDVIVFKTQRGPLVKDWGDATPATPQDVVVRVNGEVVPVIHLNPYTGQITVPKPPGLVGEPEITVDYKWMQAPTMELVGLNVKGLSLNKYDCGSGLTGGYRFPMSVVLSGSAHRQQPLLVGHRFLAFESAQTSLVNAPSTMVLNAGEATGAVQGSLPVNVLYGAESRPQNSTPTWAVRGDASSSSIISDNLFRVVDKQTGDVPEESAVVFHRGVDTSFPSSFSVIARLRVLGGDPEGVFTGVGFGVHDNAHIFLVGVLNINGIYHVGLLRDPRNPNLERSWEIGPSESLTLKAQNMGVMPSTSIPKGFRVGSHVQVLKGSQRGVYAVERITDLCDGNTEIEFKEDFKEYWDTYGNSEVVVVFETHIDRQPFTIRLDVSEDRHKTEVRILGQTTALAISVDEGAPKMPPPAESSLLFPIEVYGQAFWGSLSRQATSEAEWGFVRYSVNPSQSLLRSKVQQIVTDTSLRPEEDKESPWWPTTYFGESTSGIVLKSHSDYQDGYGYARVEPFLVPESRMDLTAKFKVLSGTTKPAAIEIRNTRRKVRLDALWVEEGSDTRRIVSLPQISMDGLVPPTEMGWEGTLQGTHEGEYYRTKFPGILYAVLDRTPEHVTQRENSRTLEVRVNIKDYATNFNGDTGIVFGVHERGLSQGWFTNFKIELADNEVRLKTPDGGTSHTTYLPVRGEHVIKVICNKPNSFDGDFTVFVDDVLVFSAVSYSYFAEMGQANTDTVFFGKEDNGLEADLCWRHLVYVVGPHSSLKQSMGVLRVGGDPWDIDSYELPRDDVSIEPNSSLTGPSIQWWDWTQDTTVRMLLDPSWGLTVYRPDKPAPPYASDPNADIATTNDISAGWINVEYGNLPAASGNLGEVLWGHIHEGSIGESLWEAVGYSLFNHSEYESFPEKRRRMWLNQYNVTHSGDVDKDGEMEVAVLKTLDSRRVSLKHTHIYAERVYKIIDGGRVFTSEEYKLDPKSQMVTLSLNEVTGEVREFSSDRANVTVVFVAGRPVTNTYLEGQALWESTTLLNEGTPTFPMSQSFSEEAECGTAQYASPEFLTVDNEGFTGKVSSICEGGLPIGREWYPGDGESVSYEEWGDPLYDNQGNVVGQVGVSEPIYANDGVTIVGHIPAPMMMSNAFTFEGFKEHYSILPLEDRLDVVGQALHTYGGGASEDWGALNETPLYSDEKVMERYNTVFWRILGNQ